MEEMEKMLKTNQWPCLFLDLGFVICLEIISQSALMGENLLTRVGETPSPVLLPPDII